jgi:hypothetical protein
MADPAAVPVENAATTFFGQVVTDAPATSFTPAQGGTLPRDLGSVFGPDGLGIVPPDAVEGATSLVSGVYRAVTGTPVTLAPQTPTTTVSSTTLIVVLVLVGVGFLLWKTS